MTPASHTEQSWNCSYLEYRDCSWLHPQAPAGSGDDGHRFRDDLHQWSFDHQPITCSPQVGAAQKENEGENNEQVRNPRVGSRRCNRTADRPRCRNRYRRNSTQWSGYTCCSRRAGCRSRDGRSEFGLPVGLAGSDRSFRTRTGGCGAFPRRVRRIRGLRSLRSRWVLAEVYPGAPHRVYGANHEELDQGIRDIAVEQTLRQRLRGVLVGCGPPVTSRRDHGPRRAPTYCRCRSTDAV